jgi:hypothetical protein
MEPTATAMTSTTPAATSTATLGHGVGRRSKR